MGDDAGVTTVVFDVGNVLLRWEPRELLPRLLPEASEAQREAVLAVVGSPLWRELDLGLGCEEAELRVEDEALRPLFGRFLRGFAPLMPLIPHGVGLLRRLREAGRHRLVVLSNFPREAFAAAERTHPDVFSAFSGFTVSGRAGCVKPDAAIYRRLLEDHALEARRAVFIDDRPENVEAARAAGLGAVLYDPLEAGRVERELAVLGVEVPPAAP